MAHYVLLLTPLVEVLKASCHANFDDNRSAELKQFYHLSLFRMLPHQTLLFLQKWVWLVRLNIMQEQVKVFHKHTNTLRSHLTHVHDTEHSLCCGWFGLAYVIISQGVKLMTPPMELFQHLGEKMAIPTNSS